MGSYTIAMKQHDTNYRTKSTLYHIYIRVEQHQGVTPVEFYVMSAVKRKVRGK